MKRFLSIGIVFSVLICLWAPPNATAGTVTYTYDDAGRLTEADYGDKVIKYTYDNTGNLTREEVALGGLWSGATDFGNGWKYLEWFSSFWVDDASSWIYHTQHGWASAYGDSTSSIWLYTSDIGWFWTSDSVYPWIYIADYGAWDIWG